jgi:hypothetical protein
MSEENKCQYCYTVLSSKGNLQTHQKRAKKCLKIQEINKSPNVDDLFICEICNKNLTSKQRYNEHIEKCNEKQEIKRLKAEIKKLQEKNTRLEINYEKTKILLTEKDNQIENQKKQIKDLQDKITNIAEIGTKKSTNIRVHNNNTLNQLIPFDLDKKKIERIVEEKLTENHILNKNEGIANFSIKYLLKENEKYKMICTDSSRNSFLYKDENENIFKDPCAANFTSMLFPAVKYKIYDTIKNKENPNEILVLLECADEIKPSSVVNILGEKLVEKPIKELFIS